MAKYLPKIKLKSSRNSDKNLKTFTQKVYEVTAKIPRGKTLSYGEVARMAGNSRASRAVGTILSKNYDPKIPCHRVIRKDGGMGGYNRGVENKMAILKQEASFDS